MVARVTITEFLLARIAEEEAAARIAQCTPEAAMNITRWHPARVLAECAAKRRIVAEVVKYEEAKRRPGAMVHVFQIWAELQIVVQALVSVYADHPDYNPAWGEQP